MSEPKDPRDHRYSKPEQGEEERVAEKVGNLVYWSFQCGMGESSLQKKAYIALLALHPGLAAELKAYNRRFPERGPAAEYRFLDDPYFKEILTRAERFVGSSAHVDTTAGTPKGVFENVYGEYRVFIEEAYKVDETPKTKEEATKEFALGVLEREALLLLRSSVNPGNVGLAEKTPKTDNRHKARLRQGGSLLMSYGFSPNREQMRKHLPVELQELWEAAADWVRNNHESFSSDLRSKLMMLKGEYEYQTKEEIPLELNV